MGIVALTHAQTTKIRCPPASPVSEADGGQAPGTLHHVMARGIDRIKIFQNKGDRNDFLNRPVELLNLRHDGRILNYPLYAITLFPKLYVNTSLE